MKMRVRDNPAESVDPIGVRLTTNYSFSYITLVPVFQYLDLTDLVCASLVCPMWKWVIDESGLMHAHEFSTCNKHINKLVKLLGNQIHHLAIYDFTRVDWFKFVNATNKLQNVKKLSVVRSYPVLQALPMIQKDIMEISVETIPPHQLCSTMEFTRTPSTLTHIDFGDTQCVSSIRPLCIYNPNLKSVAININRKFDMDLSPLLTLKELEILDLRFHDVDCNELNPHCRLWFILLSLSDLRILRIYTPFLRNFDILKVVGHMPNLEELGLTGIITHNSGPQVNLQKNLTYCTNIKKLNIGVCYKPILNNTGKCALGYFNHSILTGIQALKYNLRHFCFQVQTFNNIKEPVVPVDYANHIISCSTKDDLKTMVSDRLPDTEIVIEDIPDMPEFPIIDCIICNLQDQCITSKYKF